MSWVNTLADESIGWLGIRLIVSATLLTGAALAACRMIAAPMWRRTITQAAAIGLSLILLGELTGAIEPLGDSFSLGQGIDENLESAVVPQHKAYTDPILIDASQIARSDSTDDNAGVCVENRVVSESELERSEAARLGASTIERGASASVWLVALFVGVVWLLARCLRDGWALARLQRTAKFCDDVRIGRRLTDLARKLGVSRRVRLLESAQLVSPVAWGVCRPTIGLPGRFCDDYDPLSQDAMLAHELAHHAAWDPFWRRVMDFVVAMWWWHPLVWLLRSRFDVAAEAAADEASALVENGPARLAAALVRLGDELTAPRTAAWVGATGPFRSHLGQRVTRLLCLPPKTRRNPGFHRTLAAQSALVAFLFLLSILGTAWARPKPTSTEGEFTMQRFTHSWRASLIGSALVGLWAPGSLAIADDDDDKRPDTTARADDNDDERDEREARRDRDERERDVKGERGKREREGRGDRERPEHEALEQFNRRHKELHAELARREERVAELKKKLGQLGDGQDKEAAEIKANLDRVVAEISKLRAELKRDGADRERLETADKRSAELKRLEHQLAEHKETIARLIKEGRKDEAEKLQRQAHDLLAMLEKMRGGHHQVAEKRARPELLLEQAMRMAETAKQLAQQQEELARQVAKMKDNLKELSTAGKHDEAQRVQATIEKLHAQMEKMAAQMKLQAVQRERLSEFARAAGDKPRRAAEAAHRSEDAAKRAHHLYAAAKNLREAGMSDLAEKLEQQAKQPAATGDGKGPVEVQLEFKRYKGDKPEAAVADLMSELKAMRREMDELRGQLKRLQGERAERRQ